ncbi:MAG: oxidoreductase [Planctomycetia bacterium]|nr:oxidoreductase [Planctomycetia bacterium]
MTAVRLIAYEPGHFHAALVQKEMLPGIAPRVHVYATLGPDLLSHLSRIASFNSRCDNPTAWEVEVHTSNDPLSRMLEERPGNVVVISGRNRGKIDAILASLRAGLHVLADKPWVITTGDLSKLDEAIRTARENRLIALDIMTERHEITAALTRRLIADSEVFGEPNSGTAHRPGVILESVHYLCKNVAGKPLRRPAWFFDVEQQGEGLADVGTHLVDLVSWTLFADQSVTADDVELLRASRTPTILSRADFGRVTGEADFPPNLSECIRSGQLLHHVNTTCLYRVRGLHVWLNVGWEFEAPPGRGDYHFARYSGTKSDIEIRQGENEQFIPEVYVIPHTNDVEAALYRWVAQLSQQYAGLGLDTVRGAYRLVIPEMYRTGHEAHFAEVTRRFLAYRNDPSTLPAWETDNLRAKYYLTTHGVRLARASD